MSNAMSFLQDFLTPNTIKVKIDHKLEASGIKTSINSLLKITIISSTLLSFIILLFARDLLKDYYGIGFILALVSFWIVSLVIAIITVIFTINSFINIKTFNRKKSIEIVLADYLQLVAANIGAGMPIDQAMWYAVRSRFGILAQEIEIVAKKSISGIDITIALQDFKEKYDSKILNNSMTLLIEGLEAGGELAELITQISWNIKENEIREKEMRSNVLSYTIFIAFAALVASPFLFALSNRIVIIMTSITSKIDFSSISTVSTGSIILQGGGSGITADEFKTFAYLSLIITSSVSAMIVATVRKGNVKASIKTIPIFVAISLILFLLINLGLKAFFGDIT